jgi:hypothetical protein
VRREVVQHDVNILACVWLDGRLQEGQKVRAAARRLALAVHLTGADVERGEQVRGAVPNVVVRALLADIERDRQHRLRSVQRLDLRLLINRQDHRAARRLQVEPHDVGDLLHEIRITTDLERALPMRPQPGLPPQLRHIVVRDLHAFRAAKERSHLPARPMRKPRLAWRSCAGGGQDPGAHPSRHLLPARVTRPIQQPRNALRLIPTKP